MPSPQGAPRWSRHRARSPGTPPSGPAPRWRASGWSESPSEASQTASSTQEHADCHAFANGATGRLACDYKKSYIRELKYQWDEAKSRKNLAKHGLSFEDAAQVFSGPCVTFEDDRFENGA